MKASFTFAVHYDVTATCTSPLRTANQNADTETVLRGSDGRYRIQGSSLAGAFREWIKQHADCHTDEALFGSQSVRGSLRISDGVFSEDTKLILRPRLRINEKTGSAADGGKFDVAHLESGSEFRFTITWLGFPGRLKETETVECMLGALHHGKIQLGAQKSNGFGCVSLRVKKQCFDLFDAEDRNAWLTDCFTGADLDLPEASDNDVAFLLTGFADNLLVKASAAEHTARGSITPNLTENEMPIIPGSSVKGAIRAQIGRILDCLELPETTSDNLFGREAVDGDNGIAGKIRVEEITVPDSKTEKITRIRINRFTGGVIRSGLFTEEPISGPIRLKLTLPSEEKAGCMLLLYALRDLGLGLYNLGSGGSIGRGTLHVSELRVDAPGDRNICLTFQDWSVDSVSDPTGLIDEWRNALEVIE